MVISTAICGSAGSVESYGEITKWTLNLNVDALDATSMSSSGTKEYIACLKDADFTFDTLVPGPSLGAVTALTFSNTKATVNFNAIVTSVVTTVDVNGIVTWSYTGVSTGALT